MKQRTLIIVFGIIICLVAISLLSAQDQKEKKLEKARTVLERHHIEMESNEIPELELDLREFEVSLDQLEVSLSHLENIHIPEMNFDIPQIPPIHVEIPPIEIDIPDIDFPDIEFNRFMFEYEGPSSSMYYDLSDEEQLRISALRSMKRQQADEVIPLVEKILKEDQSPALRYEAINLLRYHLDNEKTIALLGQAAKSDKNVNVRKKAVRILGRSKNTKAVQILEEIVKRK